MRTNKLLVALACGIWLCACDDETTNRVTDGGGLGDGGLTTDAARADTATDTTPGDAFVTADAQPDALVDALGCPDLLGVYTVSYGGLSCGDFSTAANRQRIDGNGCLNRFEYSGNTKGVSGSFTVDANGSFGPVTLKLGTLDATCTGTSSGDGVVRLSCNQNACLLTFTRTGPL